MILDNYRIRKIADDIGISFGSWQAIFMDVLGMKRMTAKIVPTLLYFEQKQRLIDIAQEMLTTFSDDPDLLKKVITGEGSWLYSYNRAQSSQWKRSEELRPKKEHQVRSNVKVLLTVFFDSNSMVHHEFLPQSHTINKAYYREVMRQLREAILQKRTELWKN